MMSRKFSVLLAVSAVVLVAPACSQNRALKGGAFSELPITKVVMYQSGIGYVERASVVSDDELVLRIRPDQINDILKSLTVIDRANGRPVSISLPVDKLSMDALAQIPEQIRQGGIEALLHAFRGASVKVYAKGKNVDGRIVGIDGGNANGPVTRLYDDNGEIKEALNDVHVTILSNDNVLEVLKLKDIRSISLQDQNLVDGLNKSLDISLNEGDWRQVELRIKMDSDKKREVAMSYIVAMPTWKPAYRLILQDDDKGTLQGWAVVSNVTGSNWNDVEFSLISGQPMSFTYDLYKPLFLGRPDLSYIAPQVAAAPKIQSSGFGEAKKSVTENYPAAEQAYERSGALADRPRPSPSKMKASVSREDSGLMGYAGGNMDQEIQASAPAPYQKIGTDELLSNFASLASASQIGAFDEYHLSSGLSVNDGETALVNLLQHQLAAVEARMFEPSYQTIANTSYQTVQIKNELPTSLDAGPITIYRGSTFVGEGYLSRTSSGATAYVTFATETRITSTKSERYYIDNPFIESIRQGSVTVKHQNNRALTYELVSNIPKDSKVLIQVPVQGNWKPVSFPKDYVTTDKNYVLPISIPANSTVKLEATLSNDERVSYPLNSDSGYDVAKQLVNKGAESGLPDDIRAKLAEFVESYAKLKPIQDEMVEIQSRRNYLVSDQRELTRSLNEIKDIKSAAAAKLKDQLIARQGVLEKELVSIATRQAELSVEQSSLVLINKAIVNDLNYIKK